MTTIFLEKLQIPEGFEELLHDLLKEILREQPENINLFCREYFYAKKHGLSFHFSDIERNSFGQAREREKSLQMSGGEIEPLSLVASQDGLAKNEASEPGSSISKRSLAARQRSKMGSSYVSEKAESQECSSRVSLGGKLASDASATDVKREGSGRSHVGQQSEPISSSDQIESKTKASFKENIEEIEPKKSDSEISNKSFAKKSQNDANFVEENKINDLSEKKNCEREPSFFG